MRSDPPEKVISLFRMYRRLSESDSKLEPRFPPQHHGARWCDPVAGEQPAEIQHVEPVIGQFRVTIVYGPSDGQLCSPIGKQLNRGQNCSTRIRSIRRGCSCLAEPHLVCLQSIFLLDRMDDYSVADFQFFSAGWLRTVQKSRCSGQKYFDRLLFGCLHCDGSIGQSPHGSHHMDHSTVCTEKSRSRYQKQSSNEGTACHCVLSVVMRWWGLRRWLFTLKELFFLLFLFKLLRRLGIHFFHIRKIALSE